jgi:ECF sigma factor
VMPIFGGLSVEKIVEMQEVSPKTVQRDWDLARGWLYRELSGKKQDG